MRLVVTVLIAAAASGCAYHYAVEGETKLDKENAARRARDEVPKGIEIERARDRSANDFVIRNDLDESVFISYQHSLVEIDGKSFRVVSGQQRKIHDDADSPDAPIAKHSSADVGFYTDRENARIFHDADEVTYHIAIRRGSSGKEESAVLHVYGFDIRRKAPALRLDDDWLCLSTPTDAQKKSAEALARQRFGDGVTVTYEGCSLF